MAYPQINPDSVLTYKSALSTRLQLCSQYTEEGFMTYDEQFTDWNQLAEKLRNLPKSQIAVIAFIDRYGRDTGKFEVYTICTEEIDQFINENRRHINLKWSRIMLRTSEA